MFDFGLKSKLLLGLLTFALITIYKTDEFLSRASNNAWKINKRMYRQRVRPPDSDLMREVTSLGRKYEQQGIVYNMTVTGIIDPRTESLADKASRILAKYNWWLNGRCDCNAPIANYVKNLFRDGPSDSPVRMSDYWGQVFVHRTVVTVAYHNASRESQGLDQITLLSQGTPGRHYMIPHLIENWPGPINLALYCNPKDLASTYRFVSDQLQSSGRRNVIFHIVISTGGVYPVNWLRNLVLKNATSEYVFTIDLDFIPSNNLMPILSEHLEELRKANDDKTVLIVPALEVLDSSIKTLPLTKTEILTLIKAGKADTFHRDAKGQTMWNQRKWMKAKKSYLLSNTKPCDIKSEPYIVIKRKLSPFYPETLLERGKNKISFYFEVCAYDYNFLVVKDGFLLHKWHKLSLRATRQASRCVYSAFVAFVRFVAQRTNTVKLYEYEINADPYTRPSSFCTAIECLFRDALLVLGLSVPILICALCIYIRIYRPKATSKIHRRMLSSNILSQIVLDPNINKR